MSGVKSVFIAIFSAWKNKSLQFRWIDKEIYFALVLQNNTCASPPEKEK
ncbi:MAG: hypothetical protein ACJAT7_000269 [Psychromonas sp.]